MTTIHTLARTGHSTGIGELARDRSEEDRRFRWRKLPDSWFPASWTKQAACIGHEDLFAPKEGSHLAPGDVEFARSICAVCPVTAECRALGVTAQRDLGTSGHLGIIYGGLRPDDLREETRAENRRRRAAGARAKYDEVES